MSCTLSHAKTDHALSICTVLITKLYKPTVHYISQLPSKNSFIQWVCGWFFVCCPSSLLGIGLKIQHSRSGLCSSDYTLCYTQSRKITESMCIDDSLFRHIFHIIPTMFSVTSSLKNVKRQHVYNIRKKHHDKQLAAI